MQKSKCRQLAAFLTAERLEFVARVAAIGRQMGGLRKLSREQLARLDAILSVQLNVRPQNRM
ncbi:MAG: hypothetical protein ACE5JA_01970 [bacterium]